MEQPTVKKPKLDMAFMLALMDENRKLKDNKRAHEALKASKKKLFQDMEDIRTKAKKITDDSDMKMLINDLYDVAKGGVKKFSMHLTNVGTNKKHELEAEAKKVDEMAYQEVGKRFVDGSEKVTSSSAQTIAQGVMTGINISKDIATDMSKTLIDLLTVMLKGMKDLSSNTLKLFKTWWYLQKNIKEAAERASTSFETSVKDISDDITEPLRKEFNLNINLIEIDYAACFNGMGLKVFPNSMLTICVASVSAGTSLVIAAASGDLKHIQMDYAKCFDGMGLHLFANSMMLLSVGAAAISISIAAAGGIGSKLLASETVTQFVDAGVLGDGVKLIARVPGKEAISTCISTCIYYLPHIAVSCAALALVGYGCKYVFGKRKPEDFITRYLDYLKI